MEPQLGTNAEGAILGAIAPDDFVAFGLSAANALTSPPAYGGNVAIGDFRTDFEIPPGR